MPRYIMFLLAVFSFAHRCHTLPVPGGAVGVGMWVFRFQCASPKLSLIMLMSLSVTGCL